MHRLLFLPLLAALLAVSALGAQSVSGRVLENESDSIPVRGVRVELQTDGGDALGSALTDSTGEFHFALQDGGVYRLLASRIGFAAVESPGFDVGDAEAVTVDLRISTHAVLVAPLTITSRPEPPRSRYLERMGFYQRERLNTGLFLDRARLERSNAARLSDLLAQLPGVRRLTRDGASGVTLNRQRACPPQVVLDGQPLVESSRLDDIIGVRSVEAIELYRGPAQTPARWGFSDRGCGMLVIWTRDQN